MKSPAVFFEDGGCHGMAPLLYWRTAMELCVGGRNMLERLSAVLGVTPVGIWTREYLSRVASERLGIPANRSLSEPSVLINARWWAAKPVTLTRRCVGMIGDEVAFVVCDGELSQTLRWDVMQDDQRRSAALSGLERVSVEGEMLSHPWQFLERLPGLIEEEWARRFDDVEPKLGCCFQGDRSRLRMGVGGDIHPAAVIDVRGGPVVLGRDVGIGAFAVVEGPVFLGDGCRVNPHAWLHDGVAAGPVCKLGGEIDRCLFAGWSNKQHEGFLGHSVIGSWVNLGAGTTNSDLKNTYGSVRVAINGGEVDSGRMFVGAAIGDHVKTAIHTSIPTGAVLGFGACVTVGRAIPKWVRSFGWVTGDGVEGADALRLVRTAETAMARRGVRMTDAEKELFCVLPEIASRQEKW